MAKKKKVGKKLTPKARNEQIQVPRYANSNQSSLPGEHKQPDQLPSHQSETETDTLLTKQDVKVIQLKNIETKLIISRNGTKLLDRDTKLQEKDKETNLQGMASKLQDKDTTLQDKASRFQDTDMKMEGMASELQGKNTNLQDIAVKLQSNAEKPNDTVSKLQDKKMKLQYMASQLQDKDKKLQDMGFKDSDIKIKEMDTKLQDTGTKLQDKDTNIEDTKLEHRNPKLKNNDTHLQDDDMNQQETDTSLQDKDTSLQDKDTKLQDKDTKLQDIYTKLQDKDSRLKYLESKLKDKIRTEKLQRTEITILNTEKKELVTKLQESKRSAQGQAECRVIYETKLKETYGKLHESEKKLNRLKTYLRLREKYTKLTEAKLNETLDKLKNTETSLEQDKTKLKETEANLNCSSGKLKETESKLKLSESKLVYTLNKLSQSESKLNLNIRHTKAIAVLIKDTTAKLKLSETKVNDTVTKLKDAQTKILQHEAELKDSESKLQINETTAQKMKESLICCVCLAVPRSQRIPVCDNGHITCQDCKGNICPICRVSTTAQRFSVVASNIIDLLELECVHPGCTTKQLRAAIVLHEKICLHKVSLACPNFEVSGCKEKLSYLNLLDHLRGIHSSTVFNLQLGVPKNILFDANSASNRWNWSPHPGKVAGTEDHVMMVGCNMGDFVLISFKCLSKDRSRRYKLDFQLLDSKSGQSKTNSGETLLMTEGIQAGLKGGNVLIVHGEVYKTYLAGGGMKLVVTLKPQVNVGRDGHLEISGVNESKSPAPTTPDGRNKSLVDKNLTSASKGPAPTTPDGRNKSLGHKNLTSASKGPALTTPDGGNRGVDINMTSEVSNKCAGEIKDARSKFLTPTTPREGFSGKGFNPNPSPGESVLKSAFTGGIKLKISRARVENEMPTPSGSGVKRKLETQTGDSKKAK